MSEKRTDDRLLISQEAYQAVLAQLDSAADQIREMQEEIKMRTRIERNSEAWIAKNKRTMQVALDALLVFEFKHAQRILEVCLGADTPKDNGAGDGQ